MLHCYIVVIITKFRTWLSGQTPRTAGHTGRPPTVAAASSQARSQTTENITIWCNCDEIDVDLEKHWQ